MLRRRRAWSPPRTPTNYPSGVCVETETGFFYIKGARRYKVPMGRVLASWNFPYILKSTDEALKRIKVAGTLGFRDGTLIKTIFDGRIYLISANQRRPIKDPDVLDQLGFDRRALIEVSEAEANLHGIGEDLVGSNAI